MKTKPRIELVDAIRGFALLGILLLHSIEHFDLLHLPETDSSFLLFFDPIVKSSVWFVFAGKAYSIFSIMFGFSFFIQMRNQAEKGIDFSLRFVWRLIILFIIGYIHSLFYCGDILTVFAIMGLLLLLFNKFSNKVLTVLAVLLIIQIPTLYALLYSFYDPNYEFSQYWGSIWNEAFTTFAEGSFLEVAEFNLFNGHYAKWLFTYNSGRHLQMPALFIIGLLLGRKKVFENPEMFKTAISKGFYTSIFSFAVLYVFSLKVEILSVNNTQKYLLSILVAYFSNLTFTFSLLLGFIILYVKTKSIVSFSKLSFYGRMSLSNYVMQPLIGVIVFYGYGFELYKNMGPTLCLFYGLIFFTAQIYFSKYWLSNHRYGPLESIWRKFTYWDYDKKQTDENKGEIIEKPCSALNYCEEELEKEKI